MKRRRGIARISILLTVVALVSSACTQARAADRVIGPECDADTSAASLTATGSIGPSHIRNATTATLLLNTDTAPPALLAHSGAAAMLLPMHFFTPVGAPDSR